MFSSIIIFPVQNVRYFFDPRRLIDREVVPFGWIEIR